MHLLVDGSERKFPAEMPTRPRLVSTNYTITNATALHLYTVSQDRDTIVHYKSQRMIKFSKHFYDNIIIILMKYN